MKKIILAVISAFLFISCSSKQMTALDERIQKHIVLENLSKDLIKAFNYKTNYNGLLEFELVLLSKDDIALKYKISWLDDDGFRVKTLLDDEFKSIKLKENEEFILQRVAASKEVSNFKLTLVEE